MIGIYDHDGCRLPFGTGDPAAWSFRVPSPPPPGPANIPDLLLHKRKPAHGIRQEPLPFLYASALTRLAILFPSIDCTASGKALRGDQNQQLPEKIWQWEGIITNSRKGNCISAAVNIQYVMIGRTVAPCWLVKQARKIGGIGECFVGQI